MLFARDTGSKERGECGNGPSFSCSGYRCILATDCAGGTNSRSLQRAALLLSASSSHKLNVPRVHRLGRWETSMNAWNATLYQNLKFDFIRDIAPVASSVKTYNVMIVNPAFPANTVPEFIAYAKANPGKINMGSAGPGSSPHLYGELFKAMTGVDMVTVHYRGDGPAIPELIAGRIQVMFGSVVTWAEQIKAGTVRALAVTSATRTQLFPDLSPIGEFVPGYEGIGWQGVGAPRSTPADIIAKLNGAINAGLADPKFKSRFNDLGAETFAGSPADFGKFIVDYTEKWAKIIRAAGVKAE